MAIIHRYPDDDDPIFASDFVVTTPLPRSTPESPPPDDERDEPELDDDTD